MTIEYRQFTPAEYRRFATAIDRGFGGHYEPGRDQYELDRKSFKPEMSMGAFDGDEVVGTSGAIAFRICRTGWGDYQERRRDRRDGCYYASSAGRVDEHDEAIVEAGARQRPTCRIALGVGKHHLWSFRLWHVDSAREFPDRHSQSCDQAHARSAGQDSIRRS